MTSFSSFFVLLLAFAPLSILAQSPSTYPTLVYPIEDQFPPLAHVGSPFNFTLLQGTFASDVGNTLSYAVSGLPKWAVFNEESLLFAGVPSSFDEGRSRVKVVAIDGDLNKTSVFTLLVLASSPPLLLTPISTQLNNTVSISSAIRLPSARGVLVHPYYSFSLGFVLSTILSTTGAKIYYGALTTTSISLPSWLTFDNTTATFNGVAPGTGSWDIVMVGSEREGFGDIRETLNIEVGIHALDLVEDLAEVKGIAGTEIVSGAVATKGLRLDGLNVTREEVSAVVVLTGYEWLSFDESNFTLQGTPPASFINGTSLPIELPITFTSISTNVSIAATLPLSIVPFPFTTFTTPNLTATANTSFTASVSQYLVNRTTTLSASFVPAEVGDWLKFDATSGALSGQVPGSTSYDNAEVRVTATDPSTGLAGTLSLGVVVQGAVHVPSTASSASATASSSAGAVVGGSSGLSTAAKIAIGATLGGVFLLGLLVLLVLCCCIRRRRNRSRIAAAAAYQHEKKPPGEEQDGEMSNVDLGTSNDPFNNGRHLSTSSRNNPYGLDSPSKIKKPFLGAIPPFSALNLPGATTPTGGAPKSPTKKDRPRRLDLMRGMFGSSRAAQPDTEEDSISTGNNHQQQNESKLQKDLSGISRTLPRSDSDASFFSGMSAGGDQISAEDVDGNDPVPFGVRLVGGAGGVGFPRPSRETGTTRGREGSVSSSPTFSSVGGDGDEESRASWESERSFRWNSERDVAAGAGGLAVAGAGAAGGVDSIPRPRNGFVNRHTPTSAVFPAAQLERDQTVDSIAASSAFADASTPGQSRHQLAPLGAAVRASESQSDGFSNSQESTSFGGSVTSPLSRFGNPSSHPTGFPTLDEEHRDPNDSFSSSHSSDNHSDLLHASTSHPYSFQQDAANEAPSAAQLLAPPTPPNVPTSPNSSSSRPRPRLIPSRERIPTISHLSPRPSTSTREEELDDGDESFVDADEEEEEDEGRRMTGQSFDYVRGGEDLQGLGYPASSAIYYSSPPTEPFLPPTHQPSSNNSPPPNPSIRQVGGPPPPPPHSPPHRPVSNESGSEDPFAQYHRFSDPQSSRGHGQ